MSPMLFGQAIGRVVRKSSNSTQLGIKLVEDNTLEDLDFADDLAFLSPTHLESRKKQIA